jgi:glucokinase
MKQSQRAPKPRYRAAYVIGVDVGATKIAAGIVRFPQGAVIAHRVIRTEAHRESEEILDDLVAMIEDLMIETRLRIAGLGVGICELVSSEGKISSAATLKWTSQQVQRKLRRFGPVTIEADVRAAALAEAMFGAGRRCESFLFVSVGTGISCCLVIDGKPYLGTKGATGTMASAAVQHRCEKCRHAWNESLEDIASGRGLVAQFKRAGRNAAEARDVFASNSYAAMEVLAKGGEALGKTVALLVDVLDPDVVVIGGGVGLTKGIYWKSLVASTRAHIWSDVSRRVWICRAKTGRHAGVIGAAAAAWLACTRPPRKWPIFACRTRAHDC